MLAWLLLEGVACSCRRGPGLHALHSRACAASVCWFLQGVCSSAEALPGLQGSSQPLYVPMSQ
jgi:hypothetical protein